MSRVNRLHATLGAALGALGIAACFTAAAADGDVGYSAEISIAEIMESMVMPAAQQLWDAVGVDVTAQGEIEKKPETDEQWAQLRAAAVTLAEASNALLVQGRHAAPAGHLLRAVHVLRRGSGAAVLGQARGGDGLRADRVLRPGADERGWDAT